MNLSKKMTTIILVCSMLWGNVSTAYAQEFPITEENNEVTVDMNSDCFDVTQPYEVSKTIVNDDGKNIVIKAIYTPNEDYNPTLRWSSTKNATVGTWTSYYDGGIACSMSYSFDVSRSGSHWKISNGRNLVASAILSTIKNKKLSINRSISSANYPAEIMGVCTVQVMDTSIGAVATIDAWIKTVISDSGKLTVSGN